MPSTTTRILFETFGVDTGMTDADEQAHDSLEREALSPAREPPLSIDQIIPRNYRYDREFRKG